MFRVDFWVQQTDESKHAIIRKQVKGILENVKEYARMDHVRAGRAVKLTMEIKLLSIILHPLPKK